MMMVAHASRYPCVTIVGSADEISAGFAGAIRAEGWRWREVPDVGTLLAEPPDARGVILLRLSAPESVAFRSVRQVIRALDLPLVIFSAERDPRVACIALNMGAEEFIPLPVVLEETVARLRAVIRVHFGEQYPIASGDGYTLDEHDRRLTTPERATIKFSPAEYRLFRLLFAARNTVLPRERLIAALPASMHAATHAALNSTIARLRRKLGADRLVTVQGVGYQFIDRSLRERAERDFPHQRAITEDENRESD